MSHLTYWSYQSRDFFRISFFCCFHFRTRQAKLSKAHFYSIHFLNVRHFPGKIDNIPLLGVFLEASGPLQHTFQKALRRIFIWGWATRNSVACLPTSRPKTSNNEIRINIFARSITPNHLNIALIIDHNYYVPPSLTGERPQPIETENWKLLCLKCC